MGKITRGIQIFYQNFCYSSLLVPILLLVFMRKSAKPACVHTNPNYHQGTPGPPVWTGIIDLIMFNPAKKNRFQKTFLKKELRLFKNHEKSRKIEISAILVRFFIFSRFSNKCNSFLRKVFWNRFFGWTKHHQIYDSSLFRWPWRALMVIRVGVYTRRFCTFCIKTSSKQGRVETSSKNSDKIFGFLV